MSQEIITSFIVTLGAINCEDEKTVIIKDLECSKNSQHLEELKDLVEVVTSNNKI